MITVSRILLVVAFGIVTSAAEGATFQTLHSFAGADGEIPYGTVTLGNQNRLYGTTYFGGRYNAGEVFAFIIDSKKLSIVHAFAGSDGAAPYSGVILDKSGTLYGTTTIGGAANNGTVYKLDPVTKSLVTLHSFTGADGAVPRVELRFGETSVLYGTTDIGGSENSGTVFELNPATQAFTTLHTFSGAGDGANPRGQLAFDAHGMLYGTAAYGGVNGDGTVFRIAPDSQSFAVIHYFSYVGTNGSTPIAGLTFDPKLGIYGTTSTGGGEYSGTIFKIADPDHPFRPQITVHVFNQSVDGEGPGQLIADKTGMLYGTTGGSGPKGYGTAFKFDPSTNVLTTLYAFTGGTDGAYPNAVVMDKSGALYGTTQMGGANGLGTIFKITP